VNEGDVIMSFWVCKNFVGFLQHNSLCRVVLKSLSPCKFVSPVYFSTWSLVLSWWFLLLLDPNPVWLLAFANPF
jgi:hypothetical protein